MALPAGVGETPSLPTLFLDWSVAPGLILIRRVTSIGVRSECIDARADEREAEISWRVN